jgi:O-antigen/teichoic acid export membrane protein
LFSGVVIAASPLILALYGDSFRGNSYLFALIVIALIPTVYCNVHQQLLVARGTMWTQLWLFAPYGLVVVGGTLWYAGALTGEILAYIQLAGWVVTAIAIGIWVRIDRHAPVETPGTPSV